MLLDRLQKLGIMRQVTIFGAPRIILEFLQENLVDHPRFSSILTDEMIELLYKSAPLHDIGKVGIPDRILNKPSKLTDDEFAVMKTHTTLGHDAILAAEHALGSQTTFLSVACDIAWSHHEKWDGSGYPRGLSGDDIPLLEDLWLFRCI